MKRGIAYKLTFPNGKVYIGITRETLDQRVRRHIAYARAGRLFALSSAIRKYGEKSFVQEAVAHGTWDELKKIEVALIKEHDALGRGGYNMTGGGEGSLGVPVSDATKEKISRSLSGRRLSDAHRMHVGESQKGKVIRQETREKMRKSAQGKVISEQQRKKVSELLTGRKQSAELIAKRVAARRAKGSY